MLVNVAGGFSWQPVAEGSSDTWESLYRINLMTALNASRAAIPCLLRGTHSRIVNVGALAAQRAEAGMGPYAAAKSAVHRLTEALAQELKGRVSVNAVLPSILDTPQNRADMPGSDFAMWVKLENAAAAIAFLASPEAVDLNGALLPLAGRL